MAVSMIVEDGSIVAGANSYNELAAILVILEEHQFLLGLTVAPVIGDISEAGAIAGTRYLDVRFGQNLMGLQVSFDQTLEYPRAEVPKDAERQFFYNLDVMPTPLLAAHAVATYWAQNDTDEFMIDQETPGTIKRKKEIVGPLEEETEWIGGSSAQKVYTLIEGYMLELTDSGDGFADRI